MKKAADIIAIIIGVALFLIGIVLLYEAFPASQGIWATLPYVCVGVGCGLFGHGMGNTLARAAMKKHPDMQKELAIEQNDERNIAIANRAKSSAFDIMTFVFGALMVSFALMNAELPFILLLVCAYLFVHGCQIYYLNKYQKEM